MRDNYTKEKLNRLGFKNVFNTGCPTMWKLTEEFCSTIQIDKSENVIFTITDYNQDYRKDLELITILKANYKDVYFWAQGMNDYEYYRSFDASVTKNIIEINPSIDAFYGLLKSNISLDFIGTRLHGGIVDIKNCCRRTIIIGIDNRSIEISKDFGLKVIPRTDLHRLSTELNKQIHFKIKIPFVDINSWRSQFRIEGIK